MARVMKFLEIFTSDGIRCLPGPKAAIARGAMLEILKNPTRQSKRQT